MKPSERIRNIRGESKASEGDHANYILEYVEAIIQFLDEEWADKSLKK